jgi:hypothetical protein
VRTGLPCAGVTVSVCVMCMFILLCVCVCVCHVLILLSSPLLVLLLLATGYGLEDRGSRVPFPDVAGNFSLHLRVQAGSGAHPDSYLMGTWGSFPGGKAAAA